MFDAHTAGVYVIAVTPFTDTGAIDSYSVDSMVDFYARCGATGLTLLGMMGEAPKLTHDESIAVVRQVAKLTKLPVVVGVSAPGFAPMAALSRASMDAGAAGVMIAPVPTLKTDDQIVTYYRSVVEAIGPDIPFAIQDYPLSTGVLFTPGVIKRIIEENPSCIMLKHEDWPGLEKITAIRRMISNGGLRQISILCGNGGLFLPEEIGRGGDGAMTGYAFPEMLVSVTELIQQSKRKEAHDLFDTHLPYLRYEQQAGIGLAVRKYVLKKRGAIASDTQRKPMAKLSPEAIVEIEWLLGRLVERTGLKL